MYAQTRSKSDCDTEKCAVTASPGKSSIDEILLVYPMGRCAFEQFGDLLDGHARGQINQRVNVVGVDEVDFHVNAVFSGVIIQES